LVCTGARDVGFSQVGMGLFLMFSVVLQFSLRCVGFTGFVFLRLFTWFFIVHLSLYCVILANLVVLVVIDVYFVFPLFSLVFFYLY
jgi:hypothetical protein